MSTAQPTSATPSSRPAPLDNGTSTQAQSDASYTNGHQHHHHAPGSSLNPPASVPKKGKAKKQADPDDAAKAIAARLAQLETTLADDKEQEAEIGGFFFFPEILRKSS